MENTLMKLKDLGFLPEHILDIGGYKGYWSFSASKIFPNSNITMVEPIKYTEHQKIMNKSIFSNNSLNKINVINLLLSDEVKEVDWYEMKNTGDSLYKEKTNHFNNCVPIKKITTTIDIEFNNLYDKSPQLVKIDTQGSEIPIIKGGINTLKDTEVFILETPFVGEYNSGVGSFIDYLNFMDNIGYKPFDIAGATDGGIGFPLQIDIVFVKKNHYLFEKIQEKIVNIGK